MSKKPVVKVFDSKKGIMLTTDASKHSISGILSQGHPVIYLSRKLTNTEFNYSNIKKEALTIVWTSIHGSNALTATILPTAAVT